MHHSSGPEKSTRHFQMSLYLTKNRCVVIDVDDVDEDHCGVLTLWRAAVKGLSDQSHIVLCLIVNAAIHPQQACRSTYSMCTKQMHFLLALSTCYFFPSPAESHQVGTENVSYLLGFSILSTTGSLQGDQSLPKANTYFEVIPII